MRLTRRGYAVIFALLVALQATLWDVLRLHFGTLTYDASRVLKEVDPIAYRLGLSDYESMLEEE